MKAEWNGEVIAMSDNTVEIEGNQYFPPEDVHMEFLKKNHEEQYTCPWKGETQYYDVVVDGERNAAAAWAYHDPKPLAESIRDHFAFWRGVKVTG